MRSIDFSAFKLQCAELEPSNFKYLDLPIYFLNWLAYTKFETQAWVDLKKVLTKIFSTNSGLNNLPISTQIADFEDFGLSDEDIRTLFLPYVCMNICKAVDINTTFMKDYIQYDLERDSFAYYYNNKAKWKSNFAKKA